MGDYFEERNKLNVETIAYGIMGVEELTQQFKNVVMLKGNHDLYYRDTREVSSLEIFRDKVHLIDDFEIIDGILCASWICTGEEWDKIITRSKRDDVRFFAGHLELTNFRMNDHYVMEHGYSHKELRHLDHVFTGHYHMRQETDNVTYVGSPMPFDMNDANDIDRGFCVLDTNTGEYEFINYDKVKVRSIDYRELLSEDFQADPENTKIRIVIEDTVDDATLDMVKQKLEEMPFRDSKIAYKGNKQKDAIEQETELEGIMGIDEAVMTHLGNMEPVADIDPKMLVELYKEAKEKAA